MINQGFIWAIDSHIPLLILDKVSGASYAFSTRKLRRAYSGYCMRVRRSSDNAEQNFGFDSNDNLDSAALTSWLGGANGYVVTWYDQTINGNNATQSTAAQQLRVYLNQINGQASVGNTTGVTNTAYYSLTTPLTVVSGSNFSSITTINALASNSYGMLYGHSNTTYRSYFLYDVGGTGTLQSLQVNEGGVTRAMSAGGIRNFVASDKWTPSAPNASVYENGTQLGSTGTYIGANYKYISIILNGYNANGYSPYKSTIPETIVFASYALSDANRQLIENDQREKYGI